MMRSPTLARRFASRLRASVTSTGVSDRRTQDSHESHAACEESCNQAPCRGSGGDWYVWHAPDGLRAIAATALECMQACAQKLGVIEATYASAIIGLHSRGRTRMLRNATGP